MITKSFRSASKVFHKSATNYLRQSTRFFADGVEEVDREGWASAELPSLAEGETVPEFFNFTLSCPHKELYQDAPVRLVGVPGSAGRFAATPGHIPVVCEMQPGILSLYHERTETSGRSDQYFVSGGTCMIHPNGDMEVSTPECNIKEGLAKAKDKYSKASEEKDKLEAEIEVETYEMLEKCLGAGAQ